MNSGFEGESYEKLLVRHVPVKRFEWNTIRVTITALNNTAIKYFLVDQGKETKEHDKVKEIMPFSLKKILILHQYSSIIYLKVTFKNNLTIFMLIIFSGSNKILLIYLFLIQNYI